MTRPAAAASSRRRWRRPICLLALVAAALLALDAAAAGLDEHRPQSRLVRLVAAIEGADALVHADFAAIALEAMIEAYERELAAVAAPQRRFTARERAKQWRWARAARSFLDDVYRAREAVDRGAAVELVAGSPVEVQLLIDGALVPVAAPRIARPRELEDAVLAGFCDLHVCDPELFEATLDAPRAATGGWSFRQGHGSTYVTADGLAFMFTNVRDRALKEELCQRAAAELREVVSVIKQARSLGIGVEWDALEVTAPAGGVGERLVINASGQGTRRRMPILLRAPAVLEVARPWLEARVNDRPVQQLFPRADLLFRALLADG